MTLHDFAWHELARKITRYDLEGGDLINVNQNLDWA